MPIGNLREMVIEHCKWVASFDRVYAIYTFNRYAEMMPWLELRKK